MAMTLRLKPELQAEAAVYAERVGVSLNALLSQALRDYLDARPRTTMFGELSSLASPATPAAVSSPRARSARPVSTATTPPIPIPVAGSFKPPKSRSDPCPCGAMDGYHKVKWKHCHGRGL